MGGRRAKAIMVQGTGSSVGKSVIAAALCRMFAQDGIDVAPFKAQNMSNNSYVTADGGEMGRAQVVQAQAAGIEPTTDMNPVLLKPEADSRSQVVINGKAVGSFAARKYWGDQSDVWREVTAAYDRLAAKHDVIVLEGAGSPAEVNLRDRDIVNMRMAKHADASVILVGDIDRGGVFASLLGTVELLEPDERKLVKATLINRFRGDMVLLDPLPQMIAERTEVPVIGVVPFLYDLQVKDEDGVTFGDYDPPRSLPRIGPVAGQSPSDLVTPGSETREGETATRDQVPINRDARSLTVAVISLPRVSNHDDLDPFRRAGCRVRVVDQPAQLGDSHIVIIPGSKSSISDLQWMKSRALDKAIKIAAQQGTTVIGICGGYQMLGESISDPERSESQTTDFEKGLGLLPVRTIFNQAKTTRRVEINVPTQDSGILAGVKAAGIGYEIHMGEAEITDKNAGSLARLKNGKESWNDGLIASEGNVLGTYVHGFFDSPEILSRLLTNVAKTHGLPAPEIPEFSMEAEYDRLADHVRKSINVNLLKSFIDG